MGEARQFQIHVPSIDVMEWTFMHRITVLASRDATFWWSVPEGPSIPSVYNWFFT